MFCPGQNNDYCMALTPNPLFTFFRFHRKELDNGKSAMGRLQRPSECFVCYLKKACRRLPGFFPLAPRIRLVRGIKTVSSLKVRKLMPKTIRTGFLGKSLSPAKSVIFILDWQPSISPKLNKR